MYNVANRSMKLVDIDKNIIGYFLLSYHKSWQV